jgi:two-component system, NarL family, nitrate/nitrite response regulator NarL
VVVADDHAPTRADIRRTLEQDPGFRVCAEAEDAPSAISAALEHRPDLCLLDLTMPGGGLAACWEIAARLPETKIVVLTVSADEDDLFGALRAGAEGYLLKGIDLRRLPHALRDVLEGRAAIPGTLVRRMIDEFRSGDPRRRSLTAPDELRSRLTSREWQVLELLVHDHTTAEIAARLTITPGAARAHISAVVQKLGAQSRADAIRRFRARGGEGA